MKFPKSIVVRVSEEEFKMAEELRVSPICINISEYIRASIRHLHKIKTKKEGRPVK